VFHLAPTGILPGGYIGVDVFFVISGFLITTLLLREHAAAGRIRLRSFWVRRARRLLPALAVVVLVSTTAALAIGGDVLVGIGRQLLGAGTFSYNWLSIAAQADYFDTTTPELFRNLWSLAVEEQFYLVWPLLVIALLAVPRRWALGLVVALLALGSAAAMVALSLADVPATRLYYGTDTHAFGLALGALLAILFGRATAWTTALRRLMPMAGLLAVGGVLVLSWWLVEDGEWVFRGGLALVAVLTAIAIAGASAPGSWLGRLLDIPPLRWVGERSYGLYLWHWPIVVLVGAALPSWTSGWQQWTVGGIALAVTVVAATFSHRFVERPVRRDGFGGALRSWAGAWRGGRRRLVTVSVATLATVGLVTGATYAVVVAPTSGVAEQRIQDGLDAITAQPAPEPEPGASTEPAPLPGGDQIIAIGDSVMLAAAPSVQTAFPGIAIDAAVSRRMSAAPSMIRALQEADAMRPIVLLGLGTNGPVDVATLDEIRELVGPSTRIVLVNAQAPRNWIPGVNETLAAYAQQYRNVELANWYDAIQPNLDVLATDLIHAGGPIGGSIYADSIKAAMQRLAELPPLLTPNDYGLTPRPV